MSDSLMTWYERELRFLRDDAQAFSCEHPELARHLGVGYDTISDPHVTRMVESFALSNARLSRQLSEDFAQMSSCLLNTIFPLCLQPLPSVSMLQVPPAKDQAGVATLPSGTRFRIYNNEDQYCQFRTARDLQLCPFDITHTAVALRPFTTYFEAPEKSTALVRIDFSMLDDSRHFSDLPAFSEICFYFQGLARYQAKMYDYLCRHRCAMYLVDENGNRLKLPLSSLKPVGFSDRDCMLTHENAAFIDYQMMLELFTWPKLFFGFRLTDVDTLFRHFSSQTLSLLIFLEDISDDVFVELNSLEFQLGCAPIINLFEHVAEPMVVDHRQLSYPLVPDSHSPNTFEIQSVKEVLDITGEQPEIMPPLFGLKHNEENHDQFWLHHPPETRADSCGRLSLVSPELDPDRNETQVLSARLTCNNGLQVLDLPNNPKIECLDNITLPSMPVMLMKPTPRIQRPQNIKNRLNLLVHLRGAFTAFLSGPDPARNLRTVLNIYCLRNNSVSPAWIDSIVEVKPRPMVAPLRIGGHQCFTQGLELAFVLDPAGLKQVSKMMLVNLIDFLVAGYAGYHSFMQAVIRLKGDEGVYMRCTRRHGYQVNR